MSAGTLCDKCGSLKIYCKCPYAIRVDEGQTLSVEPMESVMKQGVLLHSDLEPKLEIKGKLDINMVPVPEKYAEKYNELLNKMHDEVRSPAVFFRFNFAPFASLRAAVSKLNSISMADDGSKESEATTKAHVKEMAQLIKQGKQLALEQIRTALGFIWAGACDTLCDNGRLSVADPSEIRRFYNAVQRTFKLAPEWRTLVAVDTDTLEAVALNIYQNILLGKNPELLDNILFSPEGTDNAKVPSQPQ